MNKEAAWMIVLIVLPTAYAYGQNTCARHGIFRVQDGSFGEAINAQGHAMEQAFACWFLM